MNTESPQTVLVVDDHPLFRRGVVQLVGMAPEFRVIGEASGGEEGISLAKRLAPDMILLDLNMKDLGGVEVLKAVKAAGLEARVIMLTVSDQADDLVAALRAGADGYLLKDMEPEQLLDHLRAAADGQVVLPERLAGLLALAMRGEARPKTAEEAGLTDQESRILTLIAEGKSNKVIARELDITEGTVKVHVKHVLKKLNLRSRVEAAVWSVKR